MEYGKMRNKSRKYCLNEKMDVINCDVAGILKAGKSISKAKILKMDQGFWESLPLKLGSL